MVPAASEVGLNDWYPHDAGKAPHRDVSGTASTAFRGLAPPPGMTLIELGIEHADKRILIVHHGPSDSSGCV